MAALSESDDGTMADSTRHGPGDEHHPQSLVDAAQRFSEAYGLVLLLTIATFVAFVALPEGRGWSALGVTIAAVTGVIGIVSSAVVAKRRRLAVLTGAVTLALAYAAVLFSEDLLMVAATGMVAFLLLACQATILKRVVLSERVSTRTILGAITSYTLMGLLFSFVFLAIVLADPHYFFEGQELVGRGDLVFFSYTTLTTTGYGNLVPADDLGQAVAMIEMLTGQVFLVTLVAGLVSLWQPARARAGR